MNVLCAHKLVRYATFAISRVNVAKVTKAKTLIRNYSLKRRGPGTSPTPEAEKVEKVNEQTIKNRFQFKIPPDGIQVFSVKSIKMYKIIAYAAIAQVTSAVALAPILMRSENTEVPQRAKNTIAVVLVAWGGALMLISKYFLSRNILNLVLTPGPNVRLETINVLGQIQQRQVPISQVQRMITEETAKRSQFIRVRVEGDTYFMDKAGEVHDEDLFYELVVADQEELNSKQ
eukprot:Phypoly_transcript_18242.p1 GENE.Phypoly_transcript_18242~~Phypoly_transcript_18242.p1  ORF type:complete len:244 (-),score=25.22 Phypoly_transcript_18242:41-733(-)